MPAVTRSQRGATPFTLELQRFMPAPVLDFGYVKQGERRIVQLHVRNPSQLQQVVTFEELRADFSLSIMNKVSLQSDLSSNRQLTLEAFSTASISVAWSPQLSGSMQEALHCQWDRERLKVLLFGTAAAVPPSTLMHRDSVNSSIPDVSSSIIQLPQTPTGQKFARCQRVGGISPGHPTFEAAMRSATAVKPGVGTPGLSRYASEAALAKAPSPVDTFAARLQRVADSPPKPVAQERPRVRPKQASGRAPMRALKLSIQQPAAASIPAGNAAIAAPAAPVLQLAPAGFRANSIAARPRTAASKGFNHFHTSLWMDKQEAALTAWLNSVLAPARGTEDDSASRALAAGRVTAKARGLLWHLYSSDNALIATMLKVEKHIDAGQLRLRDEEAELGDIRWRQAVFEALLSYHPFWLRLGLELVTHHQMPTDSGNRKGRKERLAELLDFADEYLINDKDLAQQHGPKRSTEGFHSLDYWVDLGRLVLKRFLLLVLLLDRAALSDRIPASAPLLLRRDGVCKSSDQIIGNLLNGRMAGEGNLMRHLAQLSYKLHYIQDPLADFDFTLTSLAAELRDGLRLCKLAEVLTGDQEVLQSTHLPAVRRPQQLHNMKLALGTLQKAGLILQNLQSMQTSMDIKADDVVNGHREASLTLLWQVFMQFQLPKLVDRHQLQTEVQRLRKRKHSSQVAKLKLEVQGVGQDNLMDLLAWCQAVCGCYDVVLYNFTSCFADARALCLLISHYLPSYLAKEQVFVPHITPGGQVYPADSDENENTLAEIPGPGHSLKGAALRAYSAGVVNNLGLVQAAAAALGDIPMFLSSTFFEDGVDERAVALFVSYLCCRVLEVSKEDRAAQTIQSLFRQRKARQLGQARACLYRWVAAACTVQRCFRLWQLHQGIARGHLIRQELIQAVTTLQAAWRARSTFRAYCRLQHAVLTTQAIMRGCRLRRRLFETCVLVPILEAGLNKKAALQKSRAQKCLETHVMRVQARYRSTQQQRQYLALRHAAIQVQAGFRGWQGRMQFLQAKGAAIWIQSCWRRCQAQHLLTCHKAVVKIQKNWRGHLQRAWLLRQHTAATLVQCHWRGHAQACSYQHIRQSVISIQSCVRRHQARHRFLQISHSATCIQTAFKLWQARRWQRQHEAALVIQRCYMGWSVRQRVSKQHRAAVKVQSSWRRHQAQACYARKRQATVNIQAQWRRHVAESSFQHQRRAAKCIQQSWRLHYATQQLRMHHAALTCQKIWRGSVARQALRQQATAAIHIQAKWRGHKQRRLYLTNIAHITHLQAVVRCQQAKQRYVALRQAVVVLQSEWRGRQARVLVCKIKTSIRFQAAYRGYRVRKQLLRQQQAAVRVQAAWRRCMQQKSYCQTRHSVVVIQSVVRQHLARKHFLHVLAAASVVQARWRANKAGQQQRQALQHWRSSAVRIQAQWRSAHHRSAYLRMRQSAVRIQAAVRCWHQQHRYRSMQQAAVTVQAAWRAVLQGRRCRQSLAGKHQAATCIQAHWRGHAAKQRFNMQKHAAVVLQAQARGRQARSRFLRLKHAANGIQSRYRALQAGRMVRQHLAYQHTAAVSIQSAWRRRQSRTFYLRQRSAAVKVQAAARKHAARQQYLRLKSACLVVQHRWAALKAGQAARLRLQQHHAAAVCIQAKWRGHKQRGCFLHVVACVVAVQAGWKRFIVRRAYQHKLTAAMTIQTSWRAWQARLLLRQTKAVMVIQSHVRGFQSRQQLSRLKAAAIYIQARWRGHQAVIAYRKLRQAANTLQAHARGQRARRHLAQMQASATIVQAVWRGCQARQLVQRVRAALVLQKIWRGKIARTDLWRQREAALCLQACWRGHMQRAAYLQDRAAVIKVQSLFKMLPLYRRLQQQRRAAVLIQAKWRAALARRHLAACQAALLLQRYARGWLTRRHLARQQQAATCIQSFVRMRTQYVKYRSALEMRASMRELYRVARDFSRRCAAAIKMQALARGFLARRAFARLRAQHEQQLQLQKMRETAALAAIAPWAATFAARAHFLRLRASTRLIQRCWRASLCLRNRCAVRLQAAVRMHQARCRFKVVCQAVCLIQAVWRGSFVRLHAGSHKAAVRQRLRQGAIAACAQPHRQLGNQTSQALQQLRAAKHVPQAVTACVTLSLCTQYSKHCCKLFGEAGVSALLRLMHSSNRSQPQLDFLRHSLSVLTNVASHQQLQSCLLTSDCIDVLIQQLQLYRDKEDVFLPLTSVLGKLAALPAHAEQIKGMFAEVRQMEAVAQILLRKVDTESKYLARLEGQKGSDVSAREATKRLVSATKQAHALQAVLGLVHATDEAWSEAQPKSTAAAAGPWAARNVIVRDVLNELTNAARSTKAMHNNVVKSDKQDGVKAHSKLGFNSRR